MPQIAIVQPAAPQIPPAGSPASSDKQQFSTHFEKAVSKEQDRLNTRENESGIPSQKTGEREGSTAMANDNAEHNSPTAVRTQADETAVQTVPVESGDEMGDQNLTDALLQPQIPIEKPFIFIALTQTAQTGDTAPASELPHAGKEAVLPYARVLAQGLTALSPLANTKTEDFTAVLNETTPPATPQNSQKSTSDALLLQIQQIIDNSDEKGTVTIAKVNTAPPTTINDGRVAQIALPQSAANSSAQINVAVSSQSSESRPEAPVFVLSEGFRVPTEKSDAQPTSLRQNAQQQYFEAKINTQSNSQDDSASQQNKQQNSEAGTSVPSFAGPNSTASPIIGEQTNTFAQSLAANQTPPATASSESAKTVTLPSGVVVHEENVVQQVLERFQLSRRSFDTQINIKLHPAELGELKINLTVKEGSIRANVMAQSQHAQEIIERNMTKLRTVLEGQGFSIEKITVTSTFDSTGDANLFDRQLFGQDNDTPQSNKRRNSAETGFRFDEALFPAQPAATGVNVKI